MNKAYRAALRADEQRDQSPRYETLPIQDQVQPIIPARQIPPVIATRHSSLSTPISEADALPDPLPISETSLLVEQIFCSEPSFDSSSRDFTSRASGCFSPTFGADDQSFFDSVNFIAQFADDGPFSSF